MRLRPESVFVTALLSATVGVTVGLSAAPEVSGAMPRGESGGGYGPRVNPWFVNWETPQVFPIDKTPDGSKLLVCNTPDNRLEVFDLAGAAPSLIAEIPVGLDPVSVRVRTNNEAWVVNHISDSVSVVNLTTMNVVRTIRTADEPCDVVFAGTPRRAFVTCSQVNTVQVYDPANLDVAPVSAAIDAEDPRALAVSPDGTKVYAAIFESGNRSTLVGGGSSGSGVITFPPNAVGNAASPYAGVNPPPNSGANFVPAKRAGNPTPPRVGMIVKKDDLGRWMDDNSHDWTSMVSGANAALSGRPVGWDLPDRDLAVIDTSTLGVTYVSTLMNICMAVGVNPVTGSVSVVGTDAKNEVRFEPNVNGRFLRVQHASVSMPGLGKVVTDLNPHLTYATPTVPQTERDKSIGDPRAVAWNAAGTKAYVAGMGSNNVVVINQAGARVGLADAINVGEGPTGLCLDEGRGRLYVLNRFASTLSVVDVSGESVVATVPFYDPSPAAIKVGRKHLYDTHKNSGLGQIACASCHVDARMDRLAWDLGDPSGTVDPLTNRNLGFGVPGLDSSSALVPFTTYHPMKGPMTTQTLQDIIGHEPHHWRGDRLGLEAFSPAFIGLQGDDTTLTTQEMQEFEDFLATTYFPPNPHRNFDNSLPASLPLPGHYRTGRFGNAGLALPNGNPVNGQAIYTGAGGRRIDQNAFSCVQCHTLPTGMGPDMRLSGSTFQPIAIGSNGEHHLGLVSIDGATQATFKVPQTRNMHEKAGCNFTKTSNSAGFGYAHDGAVDSLERFISEGAFSVTSDQEVADLVAFVFCIPGGDLPLGNTNTPTNPPGPTSQDTHAAVGQQTTLVSAATPEAGQLALISSMLAVANTNKVGLVVKGIYNGEHRGFVYTGSGVFQSDRVGEVISASVLQAAAAAGNELTYTVVPKGTETRIGVDRDLDGTFDGDEAAPCYSDFNQDGGIDGADVEAFFLAWAAGENAADVNQDGGIDGADVETFFVAWQSGEC
ncbi:MAG: hypothetical protein JSR77_16725 [Planctomycetes bacterium]|nr:hypothetical protein [Planctomycetota bacterium]